VSHCEALDEGIPFSGDLHNVATGPQIDGGRCKGEEPESMRLVGGFLIGLGNFEKNLPSWS
jgi:hypothetical protein